MGGPCPPRGCGGANGTEVDAMKKRTKKRTMKNAVRVARARAYLQQVHQATVGRSVSGRAILTAARAGRLKERGEELERRRHKTGGGR